MKFLIFIIIATSVFYYIYWQTENITQCIDSKWTVMTLDEAWEIWIDSECWYRLTDKNSCNVVTWTYWIDLDIEKPWCSPACVINLETKEAEINWRCSWLK